MKRFTLKMISLLLASTFVLTMSSCQTKTEKEPTVEPPVEEVKVYSTESLFSIVPQPKELKLEGEKDNYVIYDLKPAISTADQAFVQYVNAFIGYAQKINNVALAYDGGGIELKRDTSLKAGQYRIVCDKNGVAVSASDNDGITYGLATLHQILRVEADGKLVVPSYTITDQPDSSYRALMVDLARKWHTMEQIKDYIDLCYLYKIKFIHLHFTDKESYTLPSEAFPKLSSKRNSYSAQDIANLNKYALERNIEIIPEIDMPGHAACITAAYPDLFKHTGSSESNVLCMGKPNFMANMKILMEELIAMFPNSRYIHVGGDEANFSASNDCSDCKKYMQDNGIKNTEALYTHFVKEITDLVLSLGKTPVVWEGFPKEGAETISRDIVVTAWESLYHLPNDLVAEGFTVANSSWQPLYIVPPTHSGVEGGRWSAMTIMNEWNIYTWRNWWSASAAYKNPIVVEPTDKVIGGTLCAWECTYEQDIAPVKENLAAVSEKLWNVNIKVTPSSYKKTLDHIWSLADKLVDAPK